MTKEILSFSLIIIKSRQ